MSLESDKLNLEKINHLHWRIQPKNRSETMRLAAEIADQIKDAELSRLASSVLEGIATFKLTMDDLEKEGIDVQAQWEEAMRVY